ncbi:hypothetical protein NX059_006288 [Plenodomus lindquistii]|nr:hypothetical protein NX059_006288 [Plenodomus lindquistii]
MADRFAGAPANESHAPTVRRSRKWAGFKITELEGLAKLKEAHTFYDPSAYRTRRRRKAHLDDFEYFCKDQFDLVDRTQIWDRSTITQRQMDYLVGVVHTSQGQLADKIKVATLYEIKHSLYWWNALFVKDFSAIFISWHTSLMKWIHQLATHFTLSTASREKLLLTDEELSMLYRVIMSSQRGVDNSKQHFAAWLLAWTTGVRPGSITVTKGYGKGDTLSTGAVRTTDETLRWSDVQFFKNEDGRVCFRITFRFMKGNRDAYTEQFAERQKTFLFLPETSHRLELDLTLVLLGLALHRGLFPGGLEYITTTKDMFLKVDAKVNAQAVFVACDQAERTLPDTPMNFNALNPKLQAMCLEAGLPERNTMYCFRRTRIIEMKRGFNLELTKEVAGHRPDSHSHERYDTVGVGDIDIQAYRWGRDSGKSRLDLQKLFRQSLITAYNPDADADLAQTLKDEVGRRVEEKLRENEEYINMQVEVKDTVDALRKFIMDNTPEDVDVPTGYTAYIIGLYRGMLQKISQDGTVGADDILRALNEVYYRRKLLLQKLRKSLRLVVRTDIAGEMKSAVQTGKTPRGLHVGSGGASKKLVKDVESAQASIQGDLDARLHMLNEQEHADGDDDDAGADDADADADVDIDAIDQHDEAADEHHRGAPADWDSAPDGETIRVANQAGVTEADGEDGVAPTDDERMAFLKAWTAKTSLPASRLPCYLCRLDPTTDDKARDQLYVRANLNKHLKSSRHTRESQLKKACNAILAAGGKSAQIACPMCTNRKFGTTNAWVKHATKKHPEQFWDANESEESTEEDTEEEFGGADDDDDDDDEGEEPVQTYKGKGKARA